jgi:hypothetical protein
MAQQQQLTADNVVGIVSEMLGQFRIQNMIFGEDSGAEGMRNVIFGDGIKVVGDYNVEVGKKTTIPAYLYTQPDARKAFITIHEKYLEVFRDMERRHISPKGFFAKAEPVIQCMLSIVRGIDDAAAKAEEAKKAAEVAAAEAEAAKVKIEPVVDEPTSMIKK